MQLSCGYEHGEKQAGLITRNFRVLLSSRLNPKLYYFHLCIIAQKLKRIPSSKSSDCIYKKEKKREQARSFLDK